MPARVESQKPVCITGKGGTGLTSSIAAGIGIRASIGHERDVHALRTHTAFAQLQNVFCAVRSMTLHRSAQHLCHQH